MLGGVAMMPAKPIKVAPPRKTNSVVKLPCMAANMTPKPKAKAPPCKTVNERKGRGQVVNETQGDFAAIFPFLNGRIPMTIR